MNIYLVNKKSTIKGPFDITNSHGERFMKVGDFCIRSNSNRTEVLLITSDKNCWTSCKCVGAAEQALPFDVNCLLYSFNGIQKRYGNIDILKRISDVFSKTVIYEFINNILDTSVS